MSKPSILVYGAIVVGPPPRPGCGSHSSWGHPQLVRPRPPAHLTRYWARRLLLTLDDIAVHHGRLFINELAGQLLRIDAGTGRVNDAGTGPVSVVVTRPSHGSPRRPRADPRASVTGGGSVLRVRHN